MFKSIINDIRQAWYKNTLNKIIIINVCVFLFINLLKFIFTITGGVTQISPMYRTILEGLTISNDVIRNLMLPWTWITYMFLHEGLFHLVFNMILIYYAGRILGDLGGDRRVLPVYILGGLAGAVAYILFSAVLPAWPMGSGYMLGASASAMGLLWAAAILSPDYELYLIILGRVKLKWIAVALTLIDMVSLTTFGNSGGHIAHLGGALMGGLLMMRLRAGIDWTLPVSQLFDRIASIWDRDKRPKPKSPLTIVHKQNPIRQKGSSGTAASLSQQEKIDLILDKISKSGFDSLTKEEQAFLEKASDK